MNKKTIWYCHPYAGSPQEGMSYRPYYLAKYWKKAGHQAPSSLDAFSEKNMYYTEKEVDTFIKASPMYEAYQASRDDYS